jgi:plasmid stabilization system protein ParE
MTYRVELTARASRNLKRIFRYINAESSPQAFTWFNELEAAILSLDRHAKRSSVTPENRALRHLLFGQKAERLSRHLCDRRARSGRAGVAYPSRRAPAIAETAVGLSRGAG